MTTPSAFKREQRGVAIAMAVALATTIVALVFAVIADRAAVPMPFAVRIQSAIRVDLAVIVWLGAAIANVARLRFFSEDDIGGSGAGPASERVRNAAAILQNTTEQALLAIGTHVIVAAVFDASATLVATLAGLFAVGRLLFWMGYAHGARGRAFGFALTFYPSMLALLWSIVAILAGWTS